MTRKRFIKLLMAEGYSRNEANTIATDARNCGLDYKTTYKAESAICAAKLNLKNINISALCDAIGKIVDSAWKVSLAISKAMVAFAKTYQEEMEANHE